VLLVLLLGLLAHRMIGKGVAMFKASNGDACLLTLGGEGALFFFPRLPTDILIF